VRGGGRGTNQINDYVLNRKNTIDLLAGMHACYSKTQGHSTNVWRKNIEIPGTLRPGISIFFSPGIRAVSLGSKIPSYH